MFDTLGDILNPYKDGIAAIAGAATTLHSVSKVVFLNDIRKRGTADGFSSAPFLGGIVVAILSLELSFIIGNAALVRTHLIGLTINIVCMSIFFFYTSKQTRPKIWKKIKIAAIVASCGMIYAILENPSRIKARFGLLLIAFYVVLLGIPLLKIGDIIKKKSSENLPFPMILAGVVIVILWLTYAISIKERILIYQNGFLLLLLSPQLILCLIYPKTPTTPKNSDVKTIKKD